MLISEQTVLAAMLYFEQVVFCMLINKYRLEWFLLMKCKEHILLRSTNVFTGNHSKLYFWLIREGWQMPNTEFYQVDKSSHRRCSIKKAVLKNFGIFIGKHLCWSLFISFIKKRLQQRCFTVTKFLRTSAYGCFWTDFRN